MSSNSARLKRLKAVTALLADRALGPVIAASSKVQSIESKAAQLAEHRNRLMRSSADPAISATLLSQAERLRVQQAAELRKLASARAAFEHEKSKAARAVGRDLVLEKLIAKEKAEAKAELNRRKLR
ncbi:hypothetical protein [Gymnodinialimonas hymeniacidonis]|uniref:hypothetical protein n=1 Tax=Gymnodinialimonas hymeniacidonis TaxID=3126508 RepID=UPI0034C6B945